MAAEAVREPQQETQRLQSRVWMQPRLPLSADNNTAGPQRYTYWMHWLERKTRKSRTRLLRFLNHRHACKPRCILVQRNHTSLITMCCCSILNYHSVPHSSEGRAGMSLRDQGAALDREAAYRRGRKRTLPFGWKRGFRCFRHHFLCCRNHD